MTTDDLKRSWECSCSSNSCISNENFFGQNWLDLGEFG